MANHVTVSVLGTAMLEVSSERDHQGMVEVMRAHWRGQLARVLPDQPDLIVVPELCDSPVLGRCEPLPTDEHLAYCRRREEQVRTVFVETAREHNCYVVYPAMREQADGSWRNSAEIIDRKGNTAGIYSKNHPVIEEIAEIGVLCGKEAPIIECDFGRVGCVICFDLNFEELRQKYAEQRCDLLIFCSMYHGGLMQGYWAYSCRAHFVGAVCDLPSTILDPQGDLLATTTSYCDFVTRTINLDCRIAHFDQNRERFVALKEKYGRGVTIKDPGLLGSVLISSEHESIGVKEMVREFEIELLDDYLARSLAYHHDAKNIEP